MEKPLLYKQTGKSNSPPIILITLYHNILICKYFLKMSSASRKLELIKMILS